MDDLLFDPTLTSSSSDPAPEPAPEPAAEPIAVADELEDQDLAAELVGPVDGSTPTLSLEERLNTALALVWAELASRASEQSFLDLLAEVFGASPEAAADLATRLAAGDTLGLRYEIETGAEMEGAAGAYAVVGDNGVATIYISGEWLANASDDQIRMVLLEEIGHSFDTELNGGVDTAGDEGELFANLFSGVELSEEQRSAILAENDSTTL
ncbi:MAG: hypothetical protein R6W06_06550, partial [Prochlorococcaceae cyanobacterium]